jgi:hypothetical protein
MAIPNFLIMNLLRLITPEEIGDIATKHNGGRFLSLTDLVSERVEHNVYRDFSSVDTLEEIHEQQNLKAKILPFKKSAESSEVLPKVEAVQSVEVDSLSAMAEASLTSQAITQEKLRPMPEAVHQESENMSSFILIEKERLKRSQHSLKQKEIIDLYQKNSHVDVEQIKGSNNNLAQAREAGVLVNKKQY